MFALEPLAGVFGGDDERGDDDHDHAKGLERWREVAVVRPASLQGKGHGERDGGAAQEALETADDGRALLCVLLFLGDNLANSG